MKATRFYNKGDIRIEDIPEPTAAPGTVGIDVTWCDICGTGLRELMEDPIFIPPCGHPHPVSGESAPVAMGHEFSDAVYAVGEGMNDIKVSQHAVVEPCTVRDDVPTGEGSNYHLSKDMNFIGLGSCDGGLSEEIAVKRRWIHPILDKIPLDQAALIEPLSADHRAYIRSGAKESDIALVGDASPTGLLLAAIPKTKGIKVIITELNGAHRDRAREAGVADYILDPSEVDAVEEVRKLTNGRGVDVAFECTSVNRVLDTMAETCRPIAKVVVVSIWSHPATIDVHSVVIKELNMRGTIVYCNDHAKTIKLVEEGKINLGPFITQRIKLDELISGGFERLIHNNGSAVKIIVSPNL